MTPVTVQYRIVPKMCELANVLSRCKVCTQIIPKNHAHLTTSDHGPHLTPTLYTGWLQDLLFEHFIADYV